MHSVKRVVVEGYNDTFDRNEVIHDYQCGRWAAKASDSYFYMYCDKERFDWKNKVIHWRFAAIDVVDCINMLLTIESETCWVTSEVLSDVMDYIGWICDNQVI